MNFLGHFYLSGEDEGLIIGNYIADFVKGKAYQDFPSNIEKGILMHRDIDAFTDQHPIFRQSKGKLWDKYRHYAAVITDIFYDHYLAKNFNQYHHNDLTTFTQKIYETIEKYLSLVPTQPRHMFKYMKRENWLLRYQTLDGIEQSLVGMSKRTRFNSKMEQATEDLKKMYQSFEEDFRSFFPEAIAAFKPAM